MQITQCPECHTAFKVSPEHLAVANGWVRCGRCGGVFEALHHVPGQDDKASPPPSSPPSSPSASPSASTTSPAASPAPADVEQTQASAGSDIDAFHDSLMRFVPANMAPSAEQPGMNNDEVPAAARTSLFGKPKAATASSPHPPVRGWTWPLASGVLASVLLLQWGLWNRHMLVAQEPALQGVVEAVCAPLGCEWHWPQTLDAVQIENSQFTENPDGTYRLQLRLKNTQHHTVAMPLLELSLTDERDEVVLRRVFQPSELGLKDHLSALRDARSTLNFDLDDSLKPRVVGFRALIFYP